MIILFRPFFVKLVTGYLPSVVLLLSLYTVPPLMMFFSSIEGSISRSGRKKSACCKILFFTIWNVFFVNVLSGSVLNQLNVFTRPRDMPSMLAELVPKQVMIFLYRRNAIIFIFISQLEINHHSTFHSPFSYVAFKWIILHFYRQLSSSLMSSHQDGQVYAPRYCKCTT